MAYAPVAFIAPYYRKFKNYWLKAYEPGTTTPKTMASDSTGATTFAKLQINNDGFIESSGGAITTPFIDGPYDAYLFPTETEANNNDTTNAERVADNLQGIGAAQIAETMQDYVAFDFDTVADARIGLTIGGKTVDFSAGDVIRIKEREDALFDVISGKSTANGFNIISHSTLDVSFVLRESDVANIVRWGAVSGEDSTSAIQAALNSGLKKIQGGIGGNYIVSSTLSVPSGVNLFFGGAVFTSNFRGVVFEFSDGGGISGLPGLMCKIQGLGNLSLVIGDMAIRAEGVNNHPSAPTYIEAPSVSYCHIDGFGEYGVRMSYCRGGVTHIENNLIENIGYSGIGGISCEDIKCQFNQIQNISPGTGDAYGIFIDRADGLSEVSDPRSLRCHYIGNTVINVDGGGNGQGLDTHAGIDFVIDGNTIINCDSGIRLAVSVINGTPALGCFRCTVTNNVVKREISSSVNIGIGVSGALDGSSLVQYAEDCIVSNNVIVGYGVAGNADSGGIKVQATKNCKITGNELKECNSNGVLLGLDNKNIDVSVNSIIDPWDNTVTAPSCVKVFNNNNSGQIANNTYIFDDASVGSNVAIHSVRVESGLTGLDLDIYGGTFQGIDSGHLNTSINTTTGVNTTGLYKASGTAQISIVSGQSANSVDVTFNKRFPITPSITPTLRYTFQVGGKIPQIGIDNSAPPTQNGFRITAQPSDGGTWGGNATLNVFWVAQ